MISARATEQLMVHCEQCGREWSLGWLPMPVESVSLLVKHTRCPEGHAKKSHRMGPNPKATAEGDPIAWLTNGDTGTSSKTIWSVMMNRRVGDVSVPWDPDDFGRCYRLLKVMPSWRARLPEVATKHRSWARLVENWDELTALYEEELPKNTAPKLYARMQQLIGRER